MRAVLTALLLLVTGVPVAQAAPGVLDDRDRAELATAGPTATVMIATTPGRTDAVADTVRGLGGTVAVTEPEVGYLRATLPNGRVEAASRLSGVLALDLNTRFRVTEPEPAPGDGKAVSPGPDTPDRNPFLPVHETGAVDFREQHPTWDGRGVTIGVMDTGVDLLHPSLATTSTGERRMVDRFAATDPSEGSDPFEGGDPNWIALDGNGAGVVDEAVFKVYGDFDRDGDPTDRYGLRYDRAADAFRVDTDQDGDFADELVVRLYGKSFDVGRFGVDDPATPRLEQTAFVHAGHKTVNGVEYVNIGVNGTHGTHVAGIAVGKNLFGGRMNGVAPGAKIVSATACVGWCSDIAITEGMIELVARRKVDIVTMSVGGGVGVADDSNVRAVLYNRLIDTYGVQIFASNGFGVGATGAPEVNAAGSRVVSVAASISRATWKANYGIDAPSGLWNGNTGGPRPDGGFKPDLTAPGSAVSTTALGRLGGPIPGSGMTLPPGYATLEGTSMATPQVSGGAALLLSAAKATGLKVTPAQLRQALYSSARPVEGAPVSLQGNGMLNIPGAWRLLSRVQPREYEVSAPVCGRANGVGIYIRCAGGQRPGETKSYEVTVTRKSGPSGDRPHVLRWVGNDGTFSAPSYVRLPLGKPKSFTVKATAAVGARSAILQIDDPASAGVDLLTMHAVVADEGVRPEWSVAGTNLRTGHRNFFRTVPPGTKKVTVTATSDPTSMFVHVYRPDGTADWPPTSVCANGTCTIEMADPVPGIWEVALTNDYNAPTAQIPFTLSVRLS